MHVMDQRERLTVVGTPQSLDLSDFADAVREGLTQPRKALPSVFFYDEVGSRIFEQICELPEYYPTRTEDTILRYHADAVAAMFAGPVRLVEFGSGSATKTRRLIEAFLRRGNLEQYAPVDVSESMLVASSESLLDEYAGLEVSALCCTYNEALGYLQDDDGAPDGATKLILWLGSSIGNLDRDEAANFLRGVRRSMGRADRMLVGIDLRKDRATLEAAYDDAQGVTARFNVNLLARINRELGGEFDLDRFDHEAVYDEDTGVVQMYLVSREGQSVPIGGLRMSATFARGERIHTENSYKYSRSEISDLAARAGLDVERQWIDADGAFSVNLFAPIWQDRMHSAELER